MIDEKNARMLQNMLFTPLKVVHVVEIVLISAGAALLAVTVVYIIYRRQKRKAVSQKLIERTAGTKKQSLENRTVVSK